MSEGFWRAKRASLPQPFRLGAPRAGGVGAWETLERSLSPRQVESMRRITALQPKETFVLWLTAAQVAASHQAGQRTVVLRCPWERSSLPLVLERQPDDTLRSAVMRADGAVSDALRHAAELAALSPEDAAWFSSDVLVSHSPLHGPGPGESSPALHLELGGGGESMSARASFDSGRFAPWLAQVLLERCLQVLDALESPGRPLQELDLDSPAERQVLLRELGPGPARPPWRTTLARAFAERARERPGHPAVIWGERALSYGALAERAGRIARLLREQCQVRRGDLVGVCLPKSGDAIAAIVGILAAGAGYVPLDPAIPPARRRVMLEDAAPRALVVESSMLLDLDDFGGRLLAVDVQLDGAPPAGGDGWLDGGGEAAPEDPAYAIFTSGSTGRPKAVLVEQRAILGYLAWKREHYGLDGETVALQLAPLAFDSAVSDVLSTLLSGGTLVLVDGRDRLDPRVVSGALLRHGVTLFAIVPSLYRALIEGLPDLPALRAVTVAGERVPESLVALHRARFPRVRLVNEYGPTEAAVCATAHELTGHAGGEPPIGRPISNVEIRILDGRSLVPAGAVGEICIAGAGLARGYLHQPSLTAERFVPDPFSTGGGRLYRTGDLGRWRPDGTLEFAGRLDAQVKIRGNRIELGDVEEALRRHPAIKDAAVAARGEAGDAELVAYVVSEGRAGEAAVRAHLSRLLPEWMWPSRVVELAAIPLNANGKVDRAALPEPTRSAGPAAASPATGLERRIARIWKELLERPVDGADAGFFELGGHSLKAIQLVARLHRELGVELSLRDVFQHSTLGALAALAEARRAGSSPPIPRLPDAEDYAVSDAQRRLLLVEAMRGGRDAAYNIPESFVWEGELDEACFGAAVEALVGRHEALRTSFLERGGEPRQRVEASAPLPAVHRDLTSAADPGAEVAALAAEQAALPFDLGRAPLARLSVLRVAPERRVVLLTLHHLVGDGWSMRVLLRDLLELYQSLREGRPHGLPELPVQYRDYAAWQSARLAGEDGARHLDYWRERLEGATREHAVPPDRRRPARAATRGALRRFAFGPEETAGLRALARAHDASLFMVLVAAVQAYVHRTTGLRDVVLGTPMTGRLHPALEDQVGFFLNTLVLRERLPDGVTFAALVDRARQSLLEAYEHQACPFDAVVSALKAPRDPSRHSLFDVMVTFEDAGERGRLGPLRPSRGLAEGDLTAAPEVAAKFDLVVAFEGGPDAVEVTLQYDTALYGPDRMRHLESQLRALVVSAVAAPGERVDALEILSREERDRLAPIDAAAPSLEGGPSLAGLFEEQVRRRPGALAVGGSNPLTYAELDGRANGVAHALRRAAPRCLDRPVALLLERSAGYVAGALGVLKAGAGYLPIDPRLPARRIELLVRQAGSEAVVIDGDRHRALATGLRLPTVDLEQCAPADAPPAVFRDGRQLAYVMFTSGSTGVPRGVAIEQRSVVEFSRWYAGAFGVTEESRGLACCNVGFDASTMEIWPILLRGASVHPIDDDDREPARLASLLSGLGITNAFLPTPLGHLLCESQGDALPARLRLAIGGDVLSLSRLPPAARLFNGYGPTETTIFATWHPVESAEAPIPIGRPIGGARVHVLDQRLRPMPAGAVGQIAVGGSGVARGYHGDPASTAERFVPDPFSNGGRLFLTGDLGRWREDGALEFLGRRDEQVKIRGHRVELAEVEGALGSHPGVAQAAAVVHGDGPERRLAAFVVLHATEPPGAEPLDAFLRARLPAYMVPAAVVPLERLPVTPNGKVDRAALQRLPLPNAPGGEGGRPRTEAQELVATVWAEVLEQPVADPEADFFALGGDSLRAMKLVARLREALGADVPLREIFERPTLASFTEAVVARRSEAAAPALPPLRREAARAEYPLSLTQELLWRLSNALPAAAVFNVPWTLRLDGPLDAEALRDALAWVAGAHEVLRTTFHRTDGAPVQRVAEAAAVDLPLTAIDALPEDDQPQALSDELRRAAAQPFRLDAGPAWRAQLWRLQPDIHLLGVTLHHILCDGWSLDLFTRSLADAYAARVEGRSAPAGPGLRYGDYALWQRRCFAEGAFAAQLDHWRRRLAGGPEAKAVAPPSLPPAFSSPVATLGASWPAELASAIRALGRREGCTTFMALLAGLKVALSRESGEAEVRIGANFANRARDAGAVMGLFANTAVLRTNLSGAATASDLLRRVRETVLDAAANQDLPFEVLAEDLERAAGTSRQSFLPVMFLYGGRAPRPLRASGLSIQRFEWEEGPGAGALTTSGLIFGAREGAEEGDGLEATVLFKPPHATAARAGRLLESWREAMEALVRA